MNLTKLVEKKLDSYGIQIFTDYDVEDDHVFYSENMIIFVNDKEKSIGITFQATTKPERSATLALILNQIKGVDIHIMEPFIFNQDNKLVSGENAYKLIKDADKAKIVKEVQKQDIYAHILQTTKCHEC